MNLIQIYERAYDNPMLPDGQRKPNKFLGEFEVIQVIDQDMYNSTLIGRMIDTDKIYLIRETEVSYYNAGSQFEVTELEKLKMVRK